MSLVHGATTDLALPVRGVPPPAAPQHAVVVKLSEFHLDLYNRTHLVDHFPVGVGSAHLILNGLLGVVLGRRAPLAVAVGITLQSFLFDHGGRTMIGSRRAKELEAAIARALAARPER